MDAARVNPFAVIPAHVEAREIDVGLAPFYGSAPWILFLEVPLGDGVADQHNGLPICVSLNGCFRLLDLVHHPASGSVAIGENAAMVGPRRSLPFQDEQM